MQMEPLLKLQPGTVLTGIHVLVDRAWVSLLKTVAFPWDLLIS